MSVIKPSLLALFALAMPVFAVASAAHAAPPATGPYKVVASIPGTDGGWDLLGVDGASQRLYVARGAGVMAVDLATSKVTDAIVPSARGHDSMPIPGTGLVLSNSGGTNVATLFEGATGKVIATLPTGNKPDAIAWDPATRRAFVMNAGSGDITVIDPATARVVGTIAVGGSLELGAADGKGRMYVNVEDKNEVAVIDSRAMKVASRFALKGCDGPTGVAYAGDADLIVSACANGVAIVSAPDGHLVASVPVGPRPDGAVWDARRKLALIPSGGDGALYVIRLTPKAGVIQRLETARGARTIALDPTTGRVYLPSAKYAPAVGAARPAMIPGSFAVLVVAPTDTMN